MKNKIKQWKKKFSNLPVSSKVSIIIMSIFILDIMLTGVINFAYKAEYSKAKIEYSKKLSKSANSVYDINQTNITPLNKISKMIGSENIDHVTLYIDNINKPYESEYIIPTIFIKDTNNSLQLNKELFIVDKYSSFLKENNISYSFDDLNNFKNYIKKPELSHTYLPITTFLIKNIHKLFFPALILFIILTQMPSIMAKNKFDLYQPSDIKGEMKDLVGMKNIKKEILQLKDLIADNNGKYKKFGLENTFNIQFSGPAGVGKTKVAQYLAKSLDIPIIMGTGNVETGYVNGGANTIKTLFNTAIQVAKTNKQNSCIIFIDEAQSLLKRRGMDSRNKYADDASNELLAQLDGINTNIDVNLIVIVASNFDKNNEQMDEAMARRFKKKIFFRLPTIDERIEILKYYISKIDKSNIDEKLDISEIAKVTTGESPANLKTLVEEASLIAIRYKSKITNKILFQAFERNHIGVTTREITKNNKSNRNIIIHHELGHFIVDFALLMKKYNNDLSAVKENINFLKVSSEAIEGFQGVLGYALSSLPDNYLNSKTDLENKIMQLYGGHAAEEIFFNNQNVTNGALNDFKEASKILKHIIMELRFYNDYKVDFKEMNLNNDKDDIENIKDKSSVLYKKTLSIIEYNKELIAFLSKHLEQKWVLDKEQIFTLIQDFYNMEKEIT